MMRNSVAGTAGSQHATCLAMRVAETSASTCCRQRALTTFSGNLEQDGDPRRRRLAGSPGRWHADVLASARGQRPPTFTVVALAHFHVRVNRLRLGGAVGGGVCTGRRGCTDDDQGAPAPPASVKVTVATVVAVHRRWGRRWSLGHGRRRRRGGGQWRSSRASQLGELSGGGQVSRAIE
jgi:hypothetical protein